MEPAPNRASVFFRSLGCPKNQVDSEVMLGSLALEGYVVAERLEDADVAVVNTCSFIDRAREESIEAILDLVQLRESGELRALVVAGCLPQRYGNELSRELPEVDAFVGTRDFPRIASILDEALAGGQRGVYVEAARTYLPSEVDPRLLIGGGHSTYLKIAEGCDRICAFCAIPGIRGKFQSRTLDSIVAEAQMLSGQGVRELNLISQDSTSFGKDQADRPKLAELLRALDQVKGLDWIRVLYLYPTAIDDDLIATLGSGDRVLPYVDVPLQHASDAMLRAMRRGATADRQRRLVAKLRDRIPGLTLRTTFIVGFPGETEADFEALCEFARESRFDRAGVFRYSDEEDTAAFEHESKVPAELARERYRVLVALLSEIMADKLTQSVGRREPLLVDRGGQDLAVGRLRSQAPEIDGQVVVRAASGRAIAAGELVEVRITKVKGLDLEGRIEDAQPQAEAV